MDPTLSPTDRDLAIRAVLAEARDQPANGQAAVANVIRNRVMAGNYGGGVSGVVTKPYAFEPFLHAGTGKNNDPMRFDPTSPEYRQSGNIVDAVFSGQYPDPSNGATHFLAKDLQSSLGRDTPSWATDGTQTAQIGGHTFYAPEGKVDPTLASALNPTPLAQQPAGPLGAMTAGTPPAPPPVAPAAPAQGQPPAAAGQQQAILQALMKAIGGNGAATAQPHQAGALGQILFGPGGLSGVIGKAAPNGILGGAVNGISGAMGGQPVFGNTPPAPQPQAQPPAAPPIPGVGGATAAQPGPAAPGATNPLAGLLAMFGMGGAQQGA